jgi:hypothetical protein
MRTIALCVALLSPLFLSGCAKKLWAIKEGLQPQHSIADPLPVFMRNLPKGNDSYSVGFRDGCETFLSIVGPGPMRMLQSKVDGWKMTQDKLYSRGWSDGGTHCTFYLDWDTH